VQEFFSEDLLWARIYYVQDNFLYFKKKGFGIGREWKDVSDVSLADQRAMA